MLRLGVALALCIPIFLIAQGDKGKGDKGKGPNCNTVTADAVFRDNSDNISGQIDGIRSDGYGPYMGLEGATVCLLTDQDHDFILGCRSAKIEKGYGDRKVTLDFLANNSEEELFDLPFEPLQDVDVLIRVDEVLDNKDYSDRETRFLLWFDVGRDHYQLRFDGTDSDLALVTQSGNSQNRIWTIESTGTHTAWLVKLKGVSRKSTVGHFIMPFQITVKETDKDPTCL